MEIRGIKSVFFSPTGNTGRVTVHISECMARVFQVPVEVLDFTLPENRQTKIRIPEDQLVVFGLPTYAGRIPNKILPAVQELFQGNHTPAIAVVTFGNRNFDSSLTELKEELTKNNFQVFGAGAFVCQHVFSDRIGHGRPDLKDLGSLEDFAGKCARKLREASEPADLDVPVIRDGQEVGPYYRPLGVDGKPAVFLKAKPLTDPDRCSQCGFCARICPMGSIDQEDFSLVSGICIKCQACIKKCPDQAKYFEDPAFLSHVAMLEENYTQRKEPEYYV